LLGLEIIISGAAALGRRKTPRDIISSSQLLTRACLAGYTAEGLLVDRPRAPRIRGWLGFIAWLFFILCVMSGPIPTSAFSDLSRAPEAVTPQK
jgi:hypothetical protein